MSWQQSQHDDELKLQHDLLTTLDAAMHRPLTPEEAELLAWASGVKQDFSKHCGTTPQSPAT